MRFLVFMIPGVYQPKNGQKTDPHFAPDAEMMAKMGKFNEELKKAGALLSLDGLQPLTTGARLAFSGGKASVTDGPFVEAKEVVGGYWMLQAESKQQVVDWMKRCPAQDGDVIEIRQVFECRIFPRTSRRRRKKWLNTRISRPCAPMHRSSKILRRCTGAARRRHSQPGPIGWKRRGCSSVAQRLRDDDRVKLRHAACRQ